jgi:hypothetical protein
VIVTVNDRAADARNWGHGGLFTPALRTVEIADTCPQCGGPRGEVRGYNGCEDGAYYHVNVWTNSCGHIDDYEAVLAEADRLAAAREQATQ